jgi:hypothetical protein
LKEEHRLAVFEDRVLWKIFWPKREEVTGEWRTPHDGEFYDLYSSPDIIWVMRCRRMRWAWHVAHMGDSRGAYRFLVGKPEGKRPFGRLDVDGKI